MKWYLWLDVGGIGESARGFCIAYAETKEQAIDLICDRFAPHYFADDLEYLRECLEENEPAIVDSQSVAAYRFQSDHGVWSGVNP